MSRAVMQQALEALERGETKLRWAAVTALHAALAEPQTTHREGCEAVHPECKTEHEVKDLADYEFKTYKIGGFQLEAGFYSADELRDLVKAFDKMNAATERHMRRMK